MPGEDPLGSSEQGAPRLHELAELGLVSAALLHELRHTIFTLQSHLHLDPLPPHHDEPVRAHIAQLTDLVDFYGSYALTTAPSVPVDLVHEIAPITHRLTQHARAHDIELIVDLPSEPVWVRARPLAPRQVAINLARNALQATEGAADRRVWLRVIAEPCAGTVQVEDRGPGVPSEHVQSIFDAGFSTKGSQGTGAGLYLSRTLVEIDEGQLVHAAAEPRGARFSARWLAP